MDLARPCRQRSSIARSVIVVSPRRTELNGLGRCENALISRRRSHVSTASLSRAASNGLGCVLAITSYQYKPEDLFQTDSSSHSIRLH